MRTVRTRAEKNGKPISFSRGIVKHFQPLEFYNYDWEPENAPLLIKTLLMVFTEFSALPNYSFEQHSPYREK
jgi:hypothetical protein